MADESIRKLLESEERLQLPNPALDTSKPSMIEYPIPSLHIGEDSEDLFDLQSPDGLVRAVAARVWSIEFAIRNTLVASRGDVIAGVEEIQRWISNQEIVRVV